MPKQHRNPDREPRPELPAGRSWALSPLATPALTRETLAALAPDLLAELLEEGARAERARLLHRNDDEAEIERAARLIVGDGQRRR